MIKVDVLELKVIKDRELQAGLKVNRISTPGDAYRLVKEYLSYSDRERLLVILMDTKNQINGIHTVSVGSLNSSIVHPREVFKIAILKNSASIILVHNHPSGITSPSKEDIDVTKRIVDAGKILGIEVLDHIIIGDIDYTSLKEKGLI